MAAAENAIRNVKKSSGNGAITDESHNSTPQSGSIRNVRSDTKKGTQTDSGVRRISTDRSDLLHRTVTKNVRTSTMPGAPATQKRGGRETIDEAFAGEYATKGIQPVGLSDRVSINADNQPTAFENGPQITEEAYQPQRTQRRGAIKQFRNLQKLKSGRGGIKRIKATTVTAGIWAWAIPAYVIQLALVILSLLFLGVGLAVDAIFSASSAETTKGFLDSVWNISKKVINTVFDAVSSITDYFFGFDLGDFHPGGIFFILHGLIIGLFLIELLIIYFIYKFSLINPIFGRETGNKPLIFLFALIGICIPFLNLLPWAIFWTMAVWKNPK